MSEAGRNARKVALMPASIERLIVRGLHGRVDIDIPFSDDVSIFMGPNGIGKSTVLNILVAAVNAQWAKLAKQPFREVEIHFSFGVQVTISHADAVEVSAGEMSSRVADVAQKLADVDVLDAFIEGRPLDEDETHRVETLTDLQMRDLRVFRSSVLNYGQALKSASNLWAIERVIKKSFPYHILYLPTYRRVEQDLSEVIAMSSVTMRRFRMDVEDSTSQNRISQGDIIRFGMEDIDRLINDYTASIKEYSRQQINSLSTSYLIAALKTRQNFDKSFFDSLTDQLVKDVLARVDDEQLNASQRKGLTDLIKSLRGRLNTGRLSRSQEHISGYFPMLAETHDRISQRERPVQQLARLLNKYISPSKKASYDATRYKFSIVIDGRDIPLSGLSSGEKQIISLFSTLALSGNQQLYVIIDEPELSLSVLWQEMLIEDVKSIEACRNVLVVTHSPFIYGEKLLKYTHDMGDYTTKDIY
jgi:predicted ATP-binding protein involved in virulence